MKKSLQNISNDIKPEKDRDSGPPVPRQPRRKLQLDELLDRFEEAQVSTRRNLEDREWLDSPPVGKELI